MHLKFLILTSVRQKNRYLELEMLASGGKKCPLKSFSKQFCPCPKKVGHPWYRQSNKQKVLLQLVCPMPSIDNPGTRVLEGFFSTQIPG